MAAHSSTPRKHPHVGPDDYVLGVDIGGTKMAAGLVNGNGDVLGGEAGVFRVPTPARGTRDDMWNSLMSVIDQALEASHGQQIVGIGVGCAGPMVWPRGLVSPLNIADWRDFPLRPLLQKRFDDLPVRLHNDATVMALAEYWKGAGHGYQNVLGMVVSTGVGGGLVMGGRLINGGNGNTGHVGHVVVDPNGPVCRCGGRGCLEAIARGPATTAWAVEQGWTPSDPAMATDAKTLASDARGGDNIAIAAYTRAGRAVGIALASVMALLDIEIAIVGGGLVQSGSLLMDPIRESFEEHAGLSFTKDLRIVRAELDQAAGVVGAAGLVIGGSKHWDLAND